MLRHSVTQTIKFATAPVRRTITTTTLKMAEGDAGAPRAGGSARRLVLLSLFSLVGILALFWTGESLYKARLVVVVPG